MQLDRKNNVNNPTLNMVAIIAGVIALAAVLTLVSQGETEATLILLLLIGVGASTFAVGATLGAVVGVLTVAVTQVLKESLPWIGSVPIPHWSAVVLIPYLIGLGIREYFTPKTTPRGPIARLDERAILASVGPQSPLLLAACKPDGTWHFASKAFTHFTGFTLENLNREGLESLVHANDAMQLFPLWRQSIDLKQPFTADVRLRKHDGQFRWFEVRFIPERNSSGNIARWDLFLYDIEDRVIQHRKVQQREQLHRSMSEAIPGAMMIVSRDYRIEQHNQVFDEWFGRTDYSLVGRPISEAIGAEAFLQLQIPFQDAFLGKAKKVNTSFARPKLGRRSYRVHLMPDFKTGNIVELVVVYFENRQATSHKNLQPVEVIKETKPEAQRLKPGVKRTSSQKRVNFGKE